MLGVMVFGSPGRGTPVLYEQTAELQFDAAHSLRGYDGKCARLHGHGYRVQVTIEGSELDDLGMLIDFRRVKATCREIVDELDHAHLNELPAFRQTNPTCENLARHLCERLSEVLDDERVRVACVTVWETPTSAVTYRPEAKT